MQEVKTGDLVWVFWDDYATCWGTYRIATLEEHARRVLDGLETKPSHR